MGRGLWRLAARTHCFFVFIIIFVRLVVFFRGIHNKGPRAGKRKKRRAPWILIPAWKGSLTPSCANRCFFCLVNIIYFWFFLEGDILQGAESKQEKKTESTLDPDSNMARGLLSLVARSYRRTNTELARNLRGTKTELPRSLHGTSAELARN